MVFTFTLSLFLTETHVLGIIVQNAKYNSKFWFIYPALANKLHGDEALMIFITPFMIVNIIV